MAKQVPIPKFGQTVETVSIVKWHKSEGDTVTKGDVLFEVETDKAVLEVESQFEGTLLKVVIPENEEMPVMSIAAVIGEPGEDIPEIKQPEQPAPAPQETPAPQAPAKAEEPAAQPAAKPPAPTADVTAPTTPPPAAPAAPPQTEKRHKTSPRARTFAKQHLITQQDIDALQGTGPGGRIVERDVKQFLETSGYYDKKITPAAAKMARDLGISLLQLTPTGASGRVTVKDVERADAERPKPLPKMRQTIARRLQQSMQTAPHFYVTVNVDMTDLMGFRKELKDNGLSLSVNVFILKACAEALKEFPTVNSVSDDGAHVRWHSAVNIGMAVSLEQGLVVPVIRHIDQMSLDEIQAVAADMAEKARDGKLLPDDMQGGTFTVSNMGMLGVDSFTAIINPGESAILAVSSTVPTPVVNDDGDIVVRNIMKITLSSDHRLIDGAMAAAFANAIKARLENVEHWRHEV